MNLYFVTRWGNDNEGADERDTNFIVIASSHEDASTVVDDCLVMVENSKVAVFSQRISELGVAHFDVGEAKIILGPSIENALYHDDLGIPDDKKWVRDSVSEGWLTFREYYE
jgi:hypothetical protein